MPNVTISTATVPEGTCPTWIITLWPELVGLLTAELQGSLNVFNFGSSTPAPADQDKPWIKLDADGFPEGLWVYQSGAWLQEHPMVPGLVTMYEGDITAIDTFDGGEAGVVTDTTGPMWERVSAMSGRFPLSTGNQVTSGTPINVADLGGEENHTLVISEMPEHSHPVYASSAQAESGTGITRLAPSIDTQVTYGDTGTTGGDAAHNNMPPYYGIHFIKRTSRRFYRV